MTLRDEVSWLSKVLNPVIHDILLGALIGIPVWVFADFVANVLLGRQAGNLPLFSLVVEGVLRGMDLTCGVELTFFANLLF